MGTQIDQALGTQNLVAPLLGALLAWLPLIAFGLFLAITLFFYLRRGGSPALVKRRFRILAFAAVGFHAAYALLLTFVQYAVWKGGGTITEVLVSSPLAEAVPPTFPFSLLPWLGESSLGYFLFYSWGRFWLEAVLAVGIAIAFWGLLRVIKMHNSRYFREGDVELGFLTALLSQWPGFLFFLGFTFISVVFVSIFRMAFMKEKYTTLGAPFLLAALLTIIFRLTLIDLLNLQVLVV